MCCAAKTGKHKGNYKQAYSVAVVYIHAYVYKCI